MDEAELVSRQIFGNVAPALSEPLGVRNDRGDLIDARIGMQHQAMVNIEHRLSQDRHIIMGRKIIEARGNGPFKGVLGGNNAVIATPALHIVEHFRKRYALDLLDVGKTELVHEGVCCFVAVGASGA